MNRDQDHSAYWLSVAFGASLLLYLFFGHWHHYLFSNTLNSHETRQFLDLIEHPHAMKKILLDKIARDPDDALAWRLLVNCYLQLGDHESAEYASRRALLIHQKSTARIPTNSR